MECSVREGKKKGGPGKGGSGEGGARNEWGPAQRPSCLLLCDVRIPCIVSPPDMRASLTGAGITSNVRTQSVYRVAAMLSRWESPLHVLRFVSSWLLRQYVFDHGYLSCDCFHCVVHHLFLHTFSEPTAAHWFGYAALTWLE